MTYIESPEAPSAGSYRPPGVGLSKLSNVVGFSILFTEIAFISIGLRNVKSTLSIADDTGCEMFIVPFLFLVQGPDEHPAVECGPTDIQSSIIPVPFKATSLVASGLWWYLSRVWIEA